ncbi:MAG: endonuclease III [Elusimicrobia bacterium GWF2_52_66]|nr:MAG: endonuclease III [Elusimicrobia bacterium GWA2_51_34]OGR84741.1 MAG: endonuclease III [Elusimicrobia bacterium GWF2_52_66]HAF94886.1 endonuclease III [Elusimicrobiota bacterium]
MNGNKNTAEIIKLLKKAYPKAGCSLGHKNPFELLIATILSAQCTDERVNLVTLELFKKYPGPAEMAAAPLNALEILIRSTGFYHSKARSIKEAARGVAEDFGGKVPAEIKKLLTLRGVARKTANVVLGSAYGLAEGVVVDTHVKRLAFRMGFTKETDPVKIERVLMNEIPRSDWIWFAHALILHGRAVCNARRPLCAQCPLTTLCMKNGLGAKRRG